MARPPASLGAFLRLWLLMVFSYAPLKLLYDLLGPGYIDLREVALAQLIALPTGQAIVFWLVTWRVRSRGEKTVTG